jgi:hypothetical protein
MDIKLIAKPSWLKRKLSQDFIVGSYDLLPLPSEPHDRARTNRRR